MPGHAEHLPLDAAEHLGGEDDLVPADVRAVEEAQQRPADPAERVAAEHIAAEREDMAAEHVVFQREAPDVVHHPLAPLAVRAGYLHRDGFLAPCSSGPRSSTTRRPPGSVTR